MNTEMCNGFFSNGKECPKKRKCVKFLKKSNSPLTESAMTPDAVVSNNGESSCSFYRELLID